MRNVLGALYFLAVSASASYADITKFDWAIALNTDTATHSWEFPPVFVRCDIVYDLTSGNDTPVWVIIYDLAWDDGSKLESYDETIGGIFYGDDWVLMNDETPQLLCGANS